MIKPKEKTYTPIKLPPQELPESWKKVFGMLKGKKTIDPLKYQRSVRKEWAERFKRQVKLARPKSKKYGR